MVAWHPRAGSGDTGVSTRKFIFGANPGRGFPTQPDPYPFDHPAESSNAIPTNLEATLAYYQALRTYLYYKHQTTYGNANTIPGVGI